MKNKNIQNILILFGLFAAPIYFLTFRLLGFDRDTLVESGIYTYYWLILLIVAILLLIYRSFTNAKYFLYVAIFVMITFSLFALSFYLFGIDADLNFSYFQLFIGQGITTFILGLTLRFNFTKSFFKYIDIFSIIFLLVIMFDYIVYSYGFNPNIYYISLVSRNHIMIGIAASQIFVISFIRLVYIRNPLRKKIGKYLLILNLILSFITIFISDSRGAFVSILLTVILIVLYMIKHSENQKYIINKIFKYLLITGVVMLPIIILGLIFNWSSIQNLVDIVNIFEFNFSNEPRMIIYISAFEYISNSPVWGSGPMSFLMSSSLQTYPHNFILELLADYGLLGLSIMLYIVLTSIKNLSIKAKTNVIYVILLFLFIFNLWALMFSGTFLTNSYFWFFIGVSYGLKLNKGKHHEKT